MPPRKKRESLKTNLERLRNIMPVDVEKYNDKNFISKIQRRLSKKDLAIIQNKVQRHQGISQLNDSIGNIIDRTTIITCNGNCC